MSEQKEDSENYEKLIEDARPEWIKLLKERLIKENAKK